jgi:hypothetical protein
MKKINWKLVILARWIVKNIDHEFYKITASVLGSIVFTYGAMIFGKSLYALILHPVNIVDKIFGMITGILMFILFVLELKFYNYISVEFVNNKFNGEMNDELTKRLWEE